jgi:hypothetical protein
LVIFKVVSIVCSDATRWGAEALRVRETARHPKEDAANPPHIDRKKYGDCLDGAANGGHTRRMKGADQRYVWELND